MRLAPISPGRFELAASASPKLYPLSQKIPGMVYEKTTPRRYTMYRDAAERLREEWEGMGLRGDFKEVEWQPPVQEPLRLDDEWRRLRSYQKQGVSFLLQHGQEGCLLADAMRLGKTATALTAARSTGQDTLVVCPSYVREVWRKETAKWWLDAELFFPSGLKPSAIPITANVVVVHYEIFAAWADAFIAWHPANFIIDEAHFLTNESTKRSKAIRAVAAKTPVRWGLTGTPLTNRPRDLWNVVDTLSPGRFGTFFSYGMRYCNGHQKDIAGATWSKTVWDFDGRSNEEELKKRLSYFMLRRLPQDVALEIPPKTRSTIWLEGRNPRRVPVSAPSSPAAIRAMLDHSADAKFPLVWEGVADRLAQGQKVITFCWRRRVADALSRAAEGDGIATAVVHGGVSLPRRGAAIDAAKNAEGAFLLAVTIDTCSTGIDLSFADGAIFAELTYEPHELLQCEARLLNYGSPKPCFVDYFLLKGSIDEIVSESVIEKLESFEKVVGSTGEALSESLRGTAENLTADFMKAVLEWSGEE